MQRIHPEYGKEIYASFVSGNAARGFRKTCDAVQYWTDTLTQEIGPQKVGEMPFIIAAMKNIVAAYDKLAPGSERAANEMMKGMKTDVFAVNVPHGR